jgi:hypothetical protein
VNHPRLTTIATSILFFSIPLISIAQQQTTDPTTQPDVATTQTAPPQSAVGTETIIFLRHGEKPAKGLGQLNPQGFNRAIALAAMLPAKFGKPDYIFAPDPGLKMTDAGIAYNYIRPLATIEPTAIALGMPVQTPFGARQIDKLNAELTQPKYANATIFVAWEHNQANLAAANLVAQFGGNKSQVPHWPSSDYDSLYIIKITRTADAPPTIAFIHDHEGLDNQSKTMPAPATQAN